MSVGLRLKLLVSWVMAWSFRKLTGRKGPVFWEMFKLASKDAEGIAKHSEMH